MGWLAALLLASRIDSRIADRVAENWVQFSTILAAIAAALIALIGVRRQIENGEKLEESRRQASLRAAKATLPLALSRLSQVSERGAHHCLMKPEERSEKINVPDDAIGILKSCIEYSDPISSRWLAAIIARFQILTSRLTNDGIFAADFPNQVAAVDWIILRKVIEHCFDYARGTNDSLCIPLTIDLNQVSIPIDITAKFPDEIPELERNLENHLEKLQGILPEFEGGRIRALPPSA